MTASTGLDFRRLTGRAVVRDFEEDHRASTPLELLFDLTFVVAVGRAAEALHGELLERHFYNALVGFACMFFAVWWAWMNFTWFASAHDSDDVAHRLLTLVQMGGVLVLASGITAAVERGDYLAITIGYGIMRLGLIGSWLRVARDQPASRHRALRYAGALTSLQVVWFVRLALPHDWQLLAFVVLAACELAIPMWAERVVERPMYHPEHIEERYGLFVLIVLGESILSATVGFQTAVDEAGLSAGLLGVGVGGLVIAFSAWWLYFDHPGHLAPQPEQSFSWGYAHALLFLALAALGAGLHVAAESVAHHADSRVAALGVTVPAATFLAGVALVMTITGVSALDWRVAPKFIGAAAIVVIGLVAPVALAVVLCALVLAAMAVWMVLDVPAGRSRADAGVVT